MQATKKVLILITSDPRQSERVAEAVRLAAGLSAWPGTEVTIYAGDAARSLFTEENYEDCKKAETLARFLPMIQEHQLSVVFAKEGKEKLAELSLATDCLLRF